MTELDQTIPEWHIKLQNRQKTTLLTLYQKKVKSNGLKCLKSYQWNHLLEIILSWNQIDSEGVSQICKMKCSSVLNKLDLSWNKIDYLGLKILTEVPWPNLTILDLNSNPIKVVDWNASNLPHLKNLNLQRAQLNEFPSDIDKLKDLQNLTLNYNAIEKIPESINKNSKLNYLGLINNKLKQCSISIIIRLRQKKCTVNV